MKIRKAIKKIVALGTGLTLAGATMFGAMAAADLSQYPSPLFIKDGAFDGVLVVGDNAAASDVVGSIDIATSLQYQSTTTSVVSTPSTTTISVTGDSKKIEQSTDKLEFNEQLTGTGITTLTSSDLNALASGSVSNEFGTTTYDQFIELPSDAKVVFAVDPDDDTDMPAPYFLFADGATAYKYKMTFSPAWKSDNDANNDLEDFENRKLTILGTEYTLINVDHDGTWDIKMDFMGGAVQDTLDEGASSTYTISGVDYEVEVSIIALETNNKVVLIINGESTDKLLEGDTFKIADGTEVGIKTIMNQNWAGGARNVEFYLGAQKITIDDPDTENMSSSNYGLTIGSDSKGAVAVNIKSNSDAGTTTGNDVTVSEINVNYTPSQALYIPVDGKLSTAADAAEGESGNIFLGGFDFEFRGLEIGVTEDIELKPAGKKNWKLVMKNKNGDTISQEIWSYNTTGSTYDVGPLEGSNHRKLSTSNNDALSKYDYAIVGDGQTKGHGTVLQYRGINTGDDKIRMKDISSGEVYEPVHDANGVATLTLPGGYDIGLKAADTSSSTSTVNITSGSREYLYTSHGAKVQLGYNNTNASYDLYLNITSEDTEDNNQNIIRFGSPGSSFLSYTTSDGIEGVRANVAATWMNSDDELKQVGDENEYEGYTKYGIKLEVDDPTSGQTSFKVIYPDEQVTAAVFATSGVTTATTSSGTGGEITTQQITQIQVGAAKLASEVADITQVNALVIGGPCANSAAAALTGVASSIPECLAGLSIEEGNAVIKLYESGSKVALLVAGATAMDTRRASRVLANSDQYALSGMEVVVTGTSLTDISVAAPVVEASAD